jgi:hypothetical protein
MPAIRPLLVGKGEYRDKAMQLVQDMNLQNHVIFKDTIPLKELPALVTQVDVGVAS